jgi:putative transposase
MARIARVVITDLAHHITQRGDGRQFILADDAGRMVYQDLLRQAVRLHGVSVLGYCLMSNHVHVVAIPRRPGALAAAFHHVHGRYASYWNVAHTGRGHVWQGRFYSCPMDAGHLWTAMRYTELNPVRAGLVTQAAEWPWSSASAHCGSAAPNECLELAMWRQQWSESTWRAFLQQGETETELRAVRRATQSGRPLGPAEFVQKLESGTQRRLTPQKGGRSRKTAIQGIPARQRPD